MAPALAMAFASASPATAVPPPPPGPPIVDCARPIYAVDTLICEDPQLRAANDRVRALLDANPAGAADRAAPADWIESQPDWFRRRALCAFRKEGRVCVADAYAERIAVLTALGAPPAEAWRETRCTNAPWAGKLAIARQPGAVLLGDGRGTILAVAIAAGGSGWTPFVTLKRDDGRRMRFQGPAGTVECTARRRD
ncbi:hypothetical protein [Sphingomonas colocasiae]|uniref:DUF1311 domain-containing protein n=1 Tax=Sphingomonas colocasiae TaxID=1848973 RepID=A0ABS7PUG3_9SPHN|nr:hypothetical protein [Sphingomonas colocasiae]MBY8824996.1 hypothetical protein [Sphingomonas colocasiae]